MGTTEGHWKSSLGCTKAAGDKHASESLKRTKISQEARSIVVHYHYRMRPRVSSIHAEPSTGKSLAVALTWAKHKPKCITGQGKFGQPQGLFHKEMRFVQQKHFPILSNAADNMFDNELSDDGKMLMTPSNIDIYSQQESC